MITERLAVGVVVERRPARTRWEDHVWRVVAVLPGGPLMPPWSVLSEEEGTTRFLAGTMDIQVHSSDTKVYKHNIEAAQPAVYVVLRRGGGPVGWALLMVTVDPTEAQSHVDAGDDLVEAVPMPRAIFDWLSAFVSAHHVERTDWRRKRDRADPEALAPRRRRAGLEDEDE